MKAHAAIIRGLNHATRGNDERKKRNMSHNMKILNNYNAHHHIKRKAQHKGA